MRSSNTKISYAADWSEYFGYHPQDGTNDLFYNLDSLWASSAIDAVAIDNYFPISDWQASGDVDHPDVKSIYSPEYLKSNILGGEGYDWYYASAEDRSLAIRSDITDGMEEPWVWRYKDLPSWWSNQHFERQNGVKSSTPTSWTPNTKPIWFTEAGCPAINRGTNQPNVFYDPKSVESKLPFASTGTRDDLIQTRYADALLSFWDSSTTPQVPTGMI